MIASPAPAARGAGFMEARTIEAAAAGEAANGKLDRFTVWSTAALDNLLAPDDAGQTALCII